MVSDFSYSQEESNCILSLAKKALHFAVKEGQVYKEDIRDGFLQDQRGVFVTLKIKGQLRGCIGHVYADETLLENICSNAYNAALRDPRFSPVVVDELQDIDIEVSILSPISPVKDISEIVIGKHGLIIRKDFSSGLLLPQVATEYRFSVEQFLECTCQKAGLASNAWQDDIVEIYKFSAFICS